MADDTPQLIACVDEQLGPYSFARMGLSSFPQTPSVLAAWKRKTWNTNRGVVAVSLSGRVDQPGKLAQTLKLPLGRAVGYVPFFYSLGLQLILIGDSILYETIDLASALDRYDNQRVVLQSLHVIDLGMMKSVSARTWGQYATGRFQDAIERGIQAFLGEAKRGS